MASTAIDLPVGSQLEHEIDAIEAQDHNEVVRATVVKRLKLADAKAGSLESHEDVFAASKARLMARLAGNTDA
jgi:hypothetical protein